MDAEMLSALLLARGMARRDVGPRVVAAEVAEDLQSMGAGRRQPQIRLVARPALRSYEGGRRRHLTAGARPGSRHEQGSRRAGLVDPPGDWH